MRIKLIAAHQIAFSEAVPLHNCLGVLQLAASLLKRDIGNASCDVPDLSEFHHLYNRDFNETMERVLEKIITPRPDLLGFSTMANNLPIAIEICERIKKRFPRVITVLGGQGVSFCAKEILSAFPFVDTVIRGEADKAFPDYVEALIRNIKNPGIKGMVYRNAKTIIDNGWPDPIDNLDELPFPAFEFCGDYPGNNDETDSRESDYNSISLEVGRGCMFECLFCSTCHYFKQKHRLKSVARVIEEILDIRRRFGNQRLIFKHDILIYQHDYIDALCREIQRRIPGLTWKCHARFDTIDTDILKKIRDTGCDEIFLGVEAATPRMLEVINKQLDLGTFDETINVLSNLKFKFNLSFIIGFPEELPNDIEAIFSLALRVKNLCGDNAVIKIHTLVPLAGSALYKKWKNHLEYDDYGSHGTSDVPPSWKKLRIMIKQHPGIFPLYHHIPIGKQRRIQSSKFELVGLAIDSLMKYSMQLAYTGLGDRLAAAFVLHIGRIQLPPPVSCKDTDYPVLTQSIRDLILELLETYPILAGKYDTLARFEIAAQQVFKHKKNILIETPYDPLELINEIQSKAIKQEIGGGYKDRKFYFMILWDEEESKVKCMPVPMQFADLIK